MSAGICEPCGEGRHDHLAGKRCMSLAETQFGVAVCKCKAA